MKDLLLVPDDQRDEAWESQFFEQMPKAQFSFLSESPIEGPDGMPYLAVEVVDSDGEPAEKILDWLGEKGVGLAINPNKEQPDYVFSYGMIWNFLLNGEFLTEVEENKPKEESFELEPGQEMSAGTPSDTYLPKHVRGVFREFLAQQGVHQPKIIMLSQDNENFDLCFSLESLGNPPQEEWNGALQAFSWFFPMHYSFAILSEEMIQGVEFIDL